VIVKTDDDVSFDPSSATCAKLAPESCAISARAPGNSIFSLFLFFAAASV
jgi:hypothetical protein